MSGTSIIAKISISLRTVKLGGRKLMFTSFEIVSICVWLWYLFSDTCCTAAYSHH